MKRTGRYNFHLAETTHDRFKDVSSTRKEDISTVVEGLIEGWLRGHSGDST
jgi:hypothetical protein